MLDTYESLWRSVLLRCPSASVMLARQWIDGAYRELWDRRLWSWQRKWGQFIIPLVTTSGTVTVTRGSLDVQGTLTTWTTDLVGQQFRTGLQTPIYTITAVDDAAQVLTLNEPWGDASSSGTVYSIYQAYVTVPTDFFSFVTVIDARLNWQLQLNVHQEEINAWDSQRANTGTPYCVSFFDYCGTQFSNPPLPRYELWPHQRAQYVYRFGYVRRMDDLSDSGSYLPRYIRGDVLRERALAQAARWPGPASDARNPYFSLPLAQMHDAHADAMVADLERQDEEISETDVQYQSLSAMPFMAIPYGDSRYLQSHDLG